MSLESFQWVINQQYSNYSYSYEAYSKVTLFSYVNSTVGTTDTGVLTRTGRQTVNTCILPVNISILLPVNSSKNDKFHKK